MPKNILVADDSVVIQKSIGITLAQEDFAITYVGNGEDAIAKARQIKPDLVLADVVMPKRNGYEVCEALKKDPQLRSIPVLLMAGTHEPFDESREKAAGAEGHILKPFESKVLLDRVHELLAGKTQPLSLETTPPSKPAGTRPSPTPAIPIPQALATKAATSRDAPLLDLDIPEPEPVDSIPRGPTIDFLFEGKTSLEASSETETLVVEPEEPPQPPAGLQEEPNPHTLSGDSFWKLEPTAISVPPEPVAKEQPTWGEIPPRRSLSGDEPTVGAMPSAEAATLAHAVSVSLSEAQIEAIVTKVFRNVVERIAWEVVPDLAETIIKEEIARLTKESS